MQTRTPLPAILMLALLAVACTEARNSTGVISKRIGDIVKDPSATTVDLRTLPTFGWDNFYVFKPGTSREDMCRFLGANRSACGRVIRVDKTPEGHVAMVFALGGQVTHFEFHAVANGQFDVNFTEAGLPKEHAVFRIRRNLQADNEQQILLEQK